MPLPWKTCRHVSSLPPGSGSPKRFTISSRSALDVSRSPSGALGCAPRRQDTRHPKFSPPGNGDATVCQRRKSRSLVSVGCAIRFDSVCRGSGRIRRERRTAVRRAAVFFRRDRGGALDHRPVPRGVEPIQQTHPRAILTFEQLLDLADPRFGVGLADLDERLQVFGDEHEEAHEVGVRGLARAEAAGQETEGTRELRLIRGREFPMSCDGRMRRNRPGGSRDGDRVEARSTKSLDRSDGSYPHPSRRGRPRPSVGRGSAQAAGSRGLRLVGFRNVFA